MPIENTDDATVSTGAAKFPDTSLSVEQFYELQMKQEQLETQTAGKSLDDPALGEQLLDEGLDEVDPTEEPTKGIDFNNLQTPEQLQAARKNMQASYTKRMQEIAEKERQLDAQIRALAERPVEVPKFVEEPELDPFDAQSVKAWKQWQAQELKRQLAEAREADRQTMQQHLQAELAKQKFDQFVAEHPDIEQHAEAIHQLVTDSRKAGNNISVEQAYWVVVGQSRIKEQQELLQLREATRRAGLQVGVGTIRSPGKKQPPKGMTASQAYEWFEKNQ